MNTHKHARLTFARRLEIVKQMTREDLDAVRSADAHGVTSPNGQEGARSLSGRRSESDDDNQKPRGKDGKPKAGGRYRRPFGVPPDETQYDFTDPNGRICNAQAVGSISPTTLRRPSTTRRTSSWLPSL